MMTMMTMMVILNITDTPTVMTAKATMGNTLKSRLLGAAREMGLRRTFGFFRVHGSLYTDTYTYALACTCTYT